ncbi:MAG: histidine kinase [Gammaproteobacteria bacterium]|nr:histidine kinase [Gammaproteobacteria bacterium]
MHERTAASWQPLHAPLYRHPSATRPREAYARSQQLPKHTQRINYPMMINSLLFQATGTLLVLLLAFAGSTAYTFTSIKRQHNDDVILAQAARLELTAQYLDNQAMRYRQNAPRDNESYHRDLELYYQDLMQHVAVFDMLSSAFANSDFQPHVTEMRERYQPELGAEALTAVHELDANWRRYRNGLFDALGSDPAAPQLARAAEFVMRDNHLLEDAARQLKSVLQQWRKEDLQRIRRLNLAMISTGVGITLAAIAWLYLTILAPLRRTREGFHLAARGDFGISVAEQGCQEAIELTRSFNHLSSRLNALFCLIERLHAGGDLEQVLTTLARDFRAMLRLDWIGVLFATLDGRALQLEAAYIDGRPEPSDKRLYRLAGTALEPALQNRIATHLQQIDPTTEEPHQGNLLLALHDKGMHDFVLLPLSRHAAGTIPGFVVFAARRAGSYDADHLRLLNNIAELIARSFDNTARLAEYSRLATIGTFVSGIAHELRSPLTTIAMSLDHLSAQQLPTNSVKRVRLASQETTRMGRMLDEMLLYARPLRLTLEPVDIFGLLSEWLPRSWPTMATRGQRVSVAQCPSPVVVMGDRDRLLQVFDNLTRNAADAAPAGSTVTWSVRDRETAIDLCVHNQGEPIPDAWLVRLTEPFFTTKSGGTGLGLPIVRRIVEGHGGKLRIDTGPQGTRVHVNLPRLDDVDAMAHDNPQALNAASESPGAEHAPG